MFLQETYEILDCSIYDEGTIASHNDIWGTSSYGTITRQSEYSVVSRTQTTDNSSFPMTFGDEDTTIIQFDYFKVDGANTEVLVVIRQGANTNVSTLTNAQLGGVIGEWNTIQIIIDNTTPTITVNNLTTAYSFSKAMTGTGNRFRWGLYGETTEIRFKKFRVYSI